jgi:hypothetical protein
MSANSGDRSYDLTSVLTGRSNIHEVKQVPSEEFSKYLLKDEYFDFIGRVSKFKDEKRLVQADPVMFDLMKDLNFPFATHRKCTYSANAEYKSLSKYGGPEPKLTRFTAMCLDMAAEWMEKHFAPYMGNSPVVSFQYVIAEMDKRTSPGSFWNMSFPDKRTLLDETEIEDFIDWYWDDIVAGNHHIPIFTVSVKIECRKFTKMLNDELRVYMAAPIEHTACLNRLVYSMNQKLFASYPYTWSKVGMSKFRNGWNNLWNKLSRFKNGYERDAKGYDSTLFWRLFKKIVEFRFRCLRVEDQTPENKLRLWLLYYEIVHTTLVTDKGDVIRKHRGNPSGVATTTPDNTLIMFMLLAFAFIVLWFRKHPGVTKRLAERKKQMKDFTDEWLEVPEVDYVSYDMFMSNVEAALYGDDNTFTVSDSVHDWFNGPEIDLVVKELGVVFEGDSEPHTIEDMGFLSHTFTLAEWKGMRAWLPVPDLNKMTSSLLYNNRTTDVRRHFVRLCAIRVETWPDLAYRQKVDTVIKTLVQRYPQRLVGELDGVPMSVIMSMYKTDDEIALLYFGAESGSNNTRSPFRSTSELAL